MMFHSKADVMARAKQLLKEIEPPDDMFGPRYIYEIIGAAEEAAEKAAARWGADGWKGCMVYMLTDVHLSWGYVGQGQGNRPITTSVCWSVSNDRAS